MTVADSKSEGCGSPRGRLTTWMVHLVLVGLMALSGAACDPPSHAAPGPSGAGSVGASQGAAAADAVTAQPSALPPEPRGDAERGRKLVEEMQCHRCHDGLDELTAIDNDRHCFKCHQDVMADKYAHKADNERWKKNVAHLTHAPSLLSLGERYDYSWIVRYMVEPSDMRPLLETDMPRLPIERQQARDIASYLTRNAERPQPVSLDGADPNRGRQLFQDKECGKCHLMTGVEGLAGPEMPPAGERLTAPEIMLAPDLRHARERLDAGAVVAWVMDPLKVKPGTLMEKKEMTVDEARHLAAFVLTTPLSPAPTPIIPPTPKPLDRRVTYDEVAKQVLGKTCTHCHGDPDIALGDGGPGNSGGFGFKERGLELTSYERVAAGILDDAGERQSIFAPAADGTPRLVASLMARYSEVAGKPIDGIRGMPLGLPPLALDDIQLLATWVSQGRPR